jgi:hypothetical protein
MYTKKIKKCQQGVPSDWPAVADMNNKCHVPVMQNIYQLVHVHMELIPEGARSIRFSSLCFTQILSYSHTEFGQGFGPRSSLWFCTMGHRGGYGSARWDTIEDLVLHYGPQRRIWFCTMGHS